jgi:hypothetical protein
MPLGVAVMHAGKRTVMQSVGPCPAGSVPITSLIGSEGSELRAGGQLFQILLQLPLERNAQRITTPITTFEK